MKSANRSSYRLVLSVGLLTLMMAGGAVGALAQEQDSEPAGYSHARVVRLSFVEGTVTVQRPDMTDWAEAPANTPIQVAAARAAVQQATARYQSGLGNIDEVAEAQRLLTQSEIDDALARLSVWRGLLQIAAAAGDVQPFVMEASQ